MKKFLEEFRKFSVRGNAIDLAVGVIIGGAFGKIVTSLVNDVLMPPLGMALGKVDFSDLVIPLSAGSETVKSVTIRYGLFINTLIDFIIVAFVIFLVVRGLNTLKAKEAPTVPTTKDCPQCLSAVPIKAIKCAHCTSPLAV